MSPDQMKYSDLHRRRRGRNFAVGAVLLGLAVLFFFITIVKLQGTG